MKRLCVFCFAVFLGLSVALHVIGAEVENVTTAQADMAGEPTSLSIVLQTRLTAGNGLVNGDLPGAEGVARFEVSTTTDFKNFTPTLWLKARAENDFIVKTKVTALRADTQYYYRVAFGVTTNSTRTGPTSQFKTLPPEKSEREVTFAVGQSMNYSFFHYGSDGRGKGAYQGPDKGQGYPTLEQITYLNPDFMVLAGNGVYYDFPTETRVKSQKLMRQRWHEQFMQARVVKVMSQVPVYWQKNDHDFRFDDADGFGERAPTGAMGSATFREQVPLADANEAGFLPYRTQRVGKHLQLWLLEARDFRSTNTLTDGPLKSLWGMEQREWLKQTLSTSDATYKVVISPTPLIDPDDADKVDNHTNPRGFKAEGDEFFAWLKEKQFSTNHVFFVAGDRHWQYHTVNAAGFEEFGCGNLAEANARPNRRPGAGDAGGGVVRRFVQKEPAGGYLVVKVSGKGARFAFYDEKGVELYGN